jgi:gliding motility-associated-like protein
MENPTMRIVTQNFSLFGLLWLATFSLFGHPEAPSKITCITTLTRSVVADTCLQGVGRITLSHDGTAPFTYEWVHDSTLNGPDATGLEGNRAYFVRVTDSVGCSDSLNIGLASINPMGIATSPGDIVPDTCGAGLGEITIDLNNIQGGVAPFSFMWDSSANNQTTPIASDLSAGTYDVEVVDSRGCTRVLSITVGNESNGFAATTESFGAGCSGASSGSAVVRVSGGGSINTFEWTLLGSPDSVISTDTLLANVPTGNYVITVNGGTSAGACGFTRVVNIGEPSPLVAGFETIPTSECGSNDGLAIALPVGGTPPYDILWSTGETTDTAFDLVADFYRLFVSDTNGCTDTVLFPLASSPGPDFEVEILQEDNCGLGEGIARVRIDTGQGPFQYIWWTNPGQADSAYAYNLPRNPEGAPYAVAVRTIDSCFAQQKFTMPGNDPLALSVVDQQNNYCELANGAITVNISGGTQPYRYRWSTSPTVTTSTIIGLEAGTYSVVVLDSFNCDIDTTLTLLDELGYELSVETTDETCYGDEDGSATAVIAGGRPPFTYTWDTEPEQQRTQIATDLPGGVYNVIARDAAGCQREAFGEVLARNPLQAEFAYSPDIDEPRVLSVATFEFANQSLGGNAYEWDFGDGNASTATSPTYTYRDTGTYFVQLKAYNTFSGCVDSVSYGPFDIVSDGLVFIPNAFTPNDDTFNDYFEIKGTLLEQFNLQIFSRWGNVIFTSNSSENSWGGFLPNGGPAPIGVYVYKLTATLNGGVPFEATGTLSLIR